MWKDLQKLIQQMTLEEKAGLCSGLDSWYTKPVERLGIPSVMMTDGPHGVRKETDELDETQMHKSVPATCFPTGAALACSWNRDIMHAVGSAIGEQCLANDISIVLGPAVNIKRSPLCGRNFEYLSEDPYLATELATEHINGVQSKGIGTSIKHFAANNQETSRMTIDTLIDERTLREIYLASFEGAVRNAKPWTAMAAYNKLNGTYCAENKHLLTDILRDEWGFDGIVMSDWGAVNERDDGLAAGLDLEMPASGGDGDGKIVNAVKSGKLPEKVLDQAVERLLKIIFTAAENKKSNTKCDLAAHHRLARQIAGECMVLLKNSGLLPLKKSGNIAVIGAFAKQPRYQGGGSSHINPYRLDTPLQEIKALAGDDCTITYSEGYHLAQSSETFGMGLASATDIVDDALIRQAAQTASQADTAVIFAGLPDAFESEGYDRAGIHMPESHVKLIEAVASVQKNTVVVLYNGSPVEMPWLDSVAGVIEGYLCGEATGGAIADILFGDTNPSGKLAETFPVKISDNPSYLNFPGEPDKVEYREGIFIGYRYYEKKEIKPLFPFGYGLSYTRFEYTDISADSAAIDDTGTLTVSVKVKNVGNIAGKETVQLYVRDLQNKVIRPYKELKGFDKVNLAPGEEKTVVFRLEKRAFAYYNTATHDWAVQSGEFEIYAGGSSADTPLSVKVTVRNTAKITRKYTINSTVRELLDNPVGVAILRQVAGDEMVDHLPELYKDVPLRSIRMMRPEVNDARIAQFLTALNQ